jgi:hypothetical protein
MKAQKIDVNFESYIDYFQEDEYQQSISSQQTKKTTIMQPTYLLQMS